MLKVIIVDQRSNFLDDIETRLVVRDDMPFDLVAKLTSPENLFKAINEYKPDLVAVSDNVIEMEDDWEYEDVSVVSYLTSPEGEEIVESAHLPGYGIVKNSNHLINLISGPIPSLKEKKKKEKKEEPIEEINPREADVYSEEIEASEETNLLDDMEEVPEESPTPKDSQKKDGRLNRNEFQERVRSREREERRVKTQLQEEREEQQNKTTIVTVYAAKGGVGKTTISTQVATYLSMLPHGRGRYRVCIVDYNIDFGDVRSTLPFDQDTESMYDWWLDIKDRIEDGEAPEEITYSGDEIKKYLLTLNKTGLYGLCAPTRHEDTMDFEFAELEVMLRNLRDYGGFDFIVCDTGNNTRDSSILALSMADYILLVATQDATTAICNRSAQEALEKFGNIDMSKVRLVVNNILPARETGVSVQDVEDVFSFPCVARIKHNTDVIRANNNSEPIVFKGNHPITRELQNIVMFLTGQEVEEPKKEGFFSRFRKR